VITFDNVQKGVHSSFASSTTSGKCIISISTILQLSPNIVLSKDELQYFDNWKTLQFLKNKGFEKADKLSVNKKKLSLSRREKVEETANVLPCFDGNPSSADDIEKYLESLKERLINNNKKWIFLACDGSPFLIIRKLQITKKKYLQFHLVSGLLHEEMIWLSCVASLYDSIGILDPCCLLMKQNHNNLIQVNDTHKTRSTLHTITKSFHRSLVEVKSNIFTRVYQKPIKFLGDVLNCGLVLVLFYEGVRTANPEKVTLARKILYPLLFAFNHYKYSIIIADTMRYWEEAKKQHKYYKKLMEANFISLSEEVVYQGSDALQEELNKQLLKFVFN